jgi:hypothetical protein
MVQLEIETDDETILRETLDNTESKYYIKLRIVDMVIIYQMVESLEWVK